MNSRSFPAGRLGCIFGIVNALLAIGLTFASLLYVRPRDCRLQCDTPPGTPCPSGACRIGEQHAGWPLPVMIDSPGGGSPTSGWGKLGPEDPPIPHYFVADSLFYSILLWLAAYAIQSIRRRRLPLRLAAVALPLTALLAAFVWLIYAILAAYIAG